MIISYREATSDCAATLICTNAELVRAHPTTSSVSAIRVCVLSLLSILLVIMTGCRGAASLATVSGEDEAIEILNVLHDNGIEARKEEAGEEGVKEWRIMLDQGWFDSSEVAMANQVLQDNGLPRPAKTADQANAESGVFKDESTRKAEQLKEREADLQRKLRLLPGVTGVEVTIVEPEDSSININPYPSTAAVIVVTKDDPPNFEIETVRGLVARSVPKLSPENVYVTIKTKPVRPLPWREVGLQRRHKSLDAIGIGIMIILASSVVVLLLQMKRQNNELMELRSGGSDTNQSDNEEADQSRASETGMPTGVPGADTMALQQPMNTSAMDSAARRMTTGRES